MDSAPYLGGCFGHFYAYAPKKYEYPLNRYTMETKRQLDVLDRHLADHRCICSDEYTIADIAIWAWSNNKDATFNRQLRPINEERPTDSASRTGAAE